MNPTRRGFLHQAAVVAAGCTSVSSFAHAHATTPRSAATGHRNVLFDPDEIPRLQETIRHPRFAPFWESMKRGDIKADRAFLRNELKLNNHVRNLLRARHILERSAFVYALTNGQDHRAAARALRRTLEAETRERATVNPTWW